MTRKGNKFADIDVPDELDSDTSSAARKIESLAEKHKDPIKLGKSIMRALPVIDSELLVIYREAIRMLTRAQRADPGNEPFDPKKIDLCIKIINLGRVRFPEVLHYAPTVEVGGERWEIPIRNSEWEVIDGELQLKRSYKLGQSTGGKGSARCAGSADGRCVMLLRSKDQSTAGAQN